MPDEARRSDDDAAGELARRAGEIARLEELARDWDDAHLGVLTAIKAGIEELNAEAFRRLIRALRPDPAAAAALRCAVADPLIYHVLRFHGLVKEPVEQRLDRALAEVRSFLAGHGGDVELVALKLPDTVEVRLVGSCQSCPSSGETLTEGVEAAVRKHCPEILHVRRVSRGAPAGDGAQPLRFVSPFARAGDTGWTDVCALAELPDGGIIGRTVGARELLLYRAGERVSCFDNACAHLGMPLDGGEVENGTLRCSYHGFTYLLETGECLTVPEVQLVVHAVRLAGDRVAVKLAGEAR